MTIEPLVIRGRIVTFDKRSRVIDVGADIEGAVERIAAIRERVPASCAIPSPRFARSRSGFVAIDVQRLTAYRPNPAPQ